MWKVKNIRKILTILFKKYFFLRLCYHKRFKLKYTRLPPLIQALKQTLGEFQGIAALCRHSLLLFKCDFISWTGVCDFIQPTRCVNSSFTAIWKVKKTPELSLHHFSYNISNQLCIAVEPVMNKLCFDIFIWAQFSLHIKQIMTTHLKFSSSQEEKAAAQ